MVAIIPERLFATNNFLPALSSKNYESKLLFLIESFETIVSSNSNCCEKLLVVTTTNACQNDEKIF